MVRDIYKCSSKILLTAVILYLGLRVAEIRVIFTLPSHLGNSTHSVTIYALSVSTILDAWAQIAYQQILASLRMERAGQCP